MENKLMIRLYLSGLLSFFITNYLGNKSQSLFSTSTHSLVYFIMPSIKYIPGYIFLLLLIFAIMQRISELFSRQFGDLRVGNKGNARWTTPEEIKATYREIDYEPNYVTEKDGTRTLKTYPGRSGSLIARLAEKAYIDTDDAHSITIAPTRAGKGQTKVLPEIEIRSRSEEKPHMVISSVKHELLEETAEELKNRGYCVEVLNLIDLDYSMGYNCLELIKEAYVAGNIDEAVELCKTFSHPLYHNKQAKEPIWEETAMALVNALILALCHEFVNPELAPEDQRPEYVTMTSLVYMLIALSGEYQSASGTRYLLDSYFSTLPLDNPARKEYSTVAVTSGSMRTSIFGTAQGKLRQFTAPKVANMMSESTFDFNLLTQDEQPYAVFIVLPDFIETNYIIASTWIQQCYYVLSNYASLHNDRLKKRVWFCLDEFGNLPALSSMNSMISVGAGRGILFDFYVQDLIQFKINYGADIARFIETQLMNIVYIKSTDVDTRKRISNMLGDEEVIQYQRSGNAFSFNKNISENVERKPLLFASELNQLQEGENVIIRAKRKTDPMNDPQGRMFDITPYPIFNHGKNRFKRAYNYLTGSHGVFVRKQYTDLDYKRHTNHSMAEGQLTEFINRIQAQLAKSDDFEDEDNAIDDENDSFVDETGYYPPEIDDIPTNTIIMSEEKQAVLKQMSEIETYEADERTKKVKELYPNYEENPDLSHIDVHDRVPLADYDIDSVDVEWLVNKVLKDRAYLYDEMIKAIHEDELITFICDNRDIFEIMLADELDEEAYDNFFNYIDQNNALEEDDNERELEDDEDDEGEDDDDWIS